MGHRRKWPRRQLANNSHYCRAVTTSIVIYPSPHTHSKQGAHTVWVGLTIISSIRGLRWIEVGDSRRRSRQDHSAKKGQFIGDNLPWSPLTTHGKGDGAHSFPWLLRLF
ncbi:hypothetical protein PoB_004024700 [Plakobranchus ocellatus]|uniref:Uncharacterized protein n=1 Tax=Plakobranchus ocellatus TaxID=259542 RepID=A0AAV4B3M9_9GAST|nr:hypothetical protein PoB_004024700 [Plakobranchus ocellatus]